MALMACGIGPGDAVFTSPFTFIATAEVIVLLGATPVFVDIDPKTFNMDPEHLEKAIQAVQANDSSLYPLPHNSTQKLITNNDSPITNNPLTNPPLTPKAVIPVDLYGLPAEYQRINQIARKHGLWVIEDAAQSLGAEYKGSRAGNLGHIGCTSFFPAKPLGGYGDGGAIFTDDDQIAKELKSIRIHGKGSHKYDNARIGINGRLDTMQAAVLLAKLEIFPDELKKRQNVAQTYSGKLSDTEFLTLPQVSEDCKSAWAQYSILAQDSEERQQIQERLISENIPSVIYYPKPLHHQGAFEDLGYTAGDMPVSQDCASRIFSLPMHPYLTDTENETICALIKY
jgi:dTDP-4-amino-4,6-dideoxygalactose transaminase